MLWPRSLFGRLTLILLGGLAGTTLVSSWVLLQDRGQTLYQSLRADLVQRTGALVEQLNALTPLERERLLPLVNIPESRVGIGDEPLDTPDPDPDSLAAAQLVEHRLRERLGPAADIRVALADTQLSQPGWMRRRMGRGGGQGFAPPARHLDGVRPLARYFFIQARLNDGSWARFERQVPEDLFDWPTRLLLTLGILFAGVTLVSLVSVRWVIGPLRELRDAADALGKDIHRPPLAVRGPSEVAATARAFNDMQARIKRYLEDRARILAAVSHDLKTPLTRLRLRLELLDQDPVKAKLERDLDDMEAMVTATLDFMRGTDSQESSQPLDLQALLESIRDDGRDGGWAIELRGQLGAPIRGRPLALKRCIENLVQNGVRYGGGVELTLTDSDAGVLIEVADRGPGIPPEWLERVFDPFVRLESSRAQHTGGTGLGLGIARNIARAHGGDLILENRPQGGLVARLSLPR